MRPGLSLTGDLEISAAVIAAQFIKSGLRLTIGMCVDIYYEVLFVLHQLQIS